MSKIFLSKWTKVRKITSNYYLAHKQNIRKQILLTGCIVRSLKYILTLLCNTLFETNPGQCNVCRFYFQWVCKMCNMRMINTFN